MLLTSVVFLFNLLCGLVPCDPHFKVPDVLKRPRDFMEVLRNEQVKRTPTIVKTPNGVLEGYLMKAMNGRVFVAFEGIVYGEAERWKLVKPARPWRGVKRAWKPGHVCLQLSTERLLRVVGSEKCHFVNVFTPQLPSSSNNFEKYPVVVFLHGGAFVFGSGDQYGPTYLLSENSILVTINYRLGVLGFLSSGDLSLPGNLGLKDQALALKWVHENIHLFGGNPANVSLWGQSAGGSSVHLHLISDKTRNYFSTAFSSSGSAFNHWAVQSRERMNDLATRLGDKVGCQRKTGKSLFQCLQKADVNLLVANQLSLYDWFPFPPITFSPVVEPEHADAFLTVTPAEAYRTGSVSNKPYIFGVTEQEGKGIMILLFPLLRMFPLRQLWRQIAPSFLQLKNVVNAPDEMVEKISQFYFQGQDPRQVNIDAFGKMVSDRYIFTGILQSVQAQTSLESPTYLYFFSYSEGNHNLANLAGYQSREFGAGHIEDITYLFNLSLVVDGHRQTDPDHQLSSLMINMLANFAATGEPVLYRKEAGLHLNMWKPNKDPSQIKTLQLDRNIKMIPFPANILERVEFWGKLNVPNMTLRSPIIK